MYQAKDNLQILLGDGCTITTQQGLAYKAGDMVFLAKDTKFTYEPKLHPATAESYGFKWIGKDVSDAITKL